MIFIGIDPGVSGGLAALHDDGTISRAIKMPETDVDIITWLREFGCPVGAPYPRAHALIEKVHSSPQMGVVSAFTFGRGVGALRMALAAAGIPFDEITPQKWQKAMGCTQPARVAFGSKDKNITKRRAQALFPFATVTHAIADALLIAEFNRHTRLSLTSRRPEVDHGTTKEERDSQDHAEADAARRAVAGDGEHAPSEARAVRRAGRRDPQGDGGRARRRG